MVFDLVLFATVAFSTYGRLLSRVPRWCPMPFKAVPFKALRPRF